MTEDLLSMVRQRERPAPLMSVWGLMGYRRNTKQYSYLDKMVATHIPRHVEAELNKHMAELSKRHELHRAPTLSAILQHALLRYLIEVGAMKASFVSSISPVKRTQPPAPAQGELSLVQPVAALPTAHEEPEQEPDMSASEIIERLTDALVREEKHAMKWKTSAAVSMVVAVVSIGVAFYFGLH